MHFPRHAILIAAICCFAPAAAWATQPKIDSETCTSLRLEQIKFRQSGILDDMSKGAVWAKANLSAARISEIQHYLDLDEKVKFGCRDAKLSPAAERASEAAARIEMNSDADPTAPVAKDPPKPGTADAKAPAKKTVKKKAKHSDPKADGANAAKPSKSKASDAYQAPSPPVIMQSANDADTASGSAPRESSSFAGSSSDSAELPAFGFGSSMILPHTAP